MRRVYLILLLPLLVSGLPLFALDFSVEALFGNIGFPWAADTPVSGANFPSTIWNYGAKVSIADTLAENFRIETVYETDPLLRNIVRSIFSYETGILSISVGPILGVFNSLATPIKGGISAGIRIDAPGILYASMRTESSIGAGLLTAGDFMQESGEIAAGFYVFNAICTGSMATKRYYKTITAGNILVDASALYKFSVDVFSKSAPYRVKVAIGYQDISRTYPDASVDRLGMVIAETKISADISKAVGIVAQFGASLYNIGLENLSGRSPLSTSLLFQSGLGMTIRTDMLAMPNKAKGVPEENLEVEAPGAPDADDGSSPAETPKP